MRAFLLLFVVAAAVLTSACSSGVSTAKPSWYETRAGIYHRGRRLDLNPGARLGWPLERAEVSSLFGPRGWDFHDGIDFAAPEGAPVLAAHDGAVIFADNALGSFGSLVIISGDDRIITFYAHNSEMLVTPGERVLRGQQIAMVGDTGNASGPHLHFEVRLYARGHQLAAVDPLPILETQIKTPLSYKRRPGARPC